MNVNDQTGFGALGLLIVLLVMLTALGLGYLILDKHPMQKALTTDHGSSASIKGTGISGIVTNGGCPGAQSTIGSNNCYRSPEAGMTVIATDNRNGSTDSAVTDSKGYYQISVTPGTYSVSTHSTKPNIIARCQDATNVVVRTSNMTQQDFNCNNGLE